MTQCQPSNPLKLWEKFRDHFSQDILFGQKTSLNNPDLSFNQQTYDTALYLVEQILIKLSRKLADFTGLSFQIDNVIERYEKESSLICEELNYETEHLEQFLKEAIPSLNPDQRKIYRYITNPLNNADSKS